MDAAAVRGGSLPVASSSSQPSRKEWRAISEQTFRNNGNEESERAKLGQSDERTIYEDGVGALEVDFCSITIDGGSEDVNVLQQRLHDIARQREELQQMEIELKAQAIARSAVMEVQNSYEVRLKEQADASAKLKEQLQEREQYVCELELKMEEKDRELHAVNNEAAWAKEDFLREQNEKLATFRRERDNSEAEKAKHLKQIHDLQEHIKEKDSQFLALEEQHRVVQETLLFKEEQLREAQAWIARLQEMGALQSSSLQAELRERTDQFHQYYIGFQRQFMDMERHHLQTVQQLQLELAEARERNGVHSDGSQTAHGASMDSSLFVQNQGNQKNADEGNSNGQSRSMPNGKLDTVPFSVSSSNASTKAEQLPGIPLAPSSVVRVGNFLPPGHVNPLSPFALHPQGVLQSISSTNSAVPPSQLGHFQPLASIEAHQHWQNQQAVPDVSQVNQNEHRASQPDQNLLNSGVHYSYEFPVEGREVYEDRFSTHLNQQQMPGPMISGSSEELQAAESNGKPYQVSQGPKEGANINHDFHDTFGFDPPEQKSEVQFENNSSSIKQTQGQVFNLSQECPTNLPTSAYQINSLSSKNTAECNGNVKTSTEGSESTPRPSGTLTAGKVMEPAMLDERSLLACIVRAIPAGSGNGIRIGTTLPNRLGKMLAPLHWHDYKKQYGKLDDFVAQHPELFVIEGDFIHLREGAQEIISATTAVAKVAAAAASSSPYSSLLPSVAVTPVAQGNRLKKASLVESKPLNIAPSTEGAFLTNQVDAGGKHVHIPKLQNQQLNGITFNALQGISDVKGLSKTKDHEESDGSSSEMTTDHSPMRVAVSNGVNLSRTMLSSSQNKVSGNVRQSNGGRRSSGAGSTSRR